MYTSNIADEQNNLKTFDLIHQSKWQDIIQFILDTAEGKQEVKSLGIDLLYTAVEYRAPADLIMFLFDLIERENGKQMTLDPTMLRKALYYHPTSTKTSECIDQYSRRWEQSERINVSRFLSGKITRRNSICQ